jgi:hypothetical protein
MLRDNGGRPGSATFETRYGIEYCNEKPRLTVSCLLPAGKNVFGLLPSANWNPAKPVNASGRKYQGNRI